MPSTSPVSGSASKALACRTQTRRRAHRSEISSVGGTSPHALEIAAGALISQRAASQPDANMDSRGSRRLCAASAWGPHHSRLGGASVTDRTLIRRSPQRDLQHAHGNGRSVKAQRHAAVPCGGFRSCGAFRNPQRSHTCWNQRTKRNNWGTRIDPHQDALTPTAPAPFTTAPAQYTTINARAPEASQCAAVL
jgi:hypothetical protein